MESFNTDQSGEQEQSTDQLTFKVGDREYNADAAAKKISSADEHIQRIEQENKEYREKMAALEAQVAQSTKLEEALQKLQADKPESRSTQETPSFDPEKLSEAAREAALSAIREQEEARLAQEKEQQSKATFQETFNKLADIYGKDGIVDALSEAGISTDVADQMAKDPVQSKVLLRALQADKAKPSLNPSGDVNGTSLSRNAPKQNMFAGKDKITSSTIMEKLLNG